MPKSDLPDRPSLEYLRKVAKERLQEMRRADPAATLSLAQLAMARDHGFSSWRALKAEVDKARGSDIDALFIACFTGDVETLRALLTRNASLANARGHGGTTPLHAAIHHPEAIRVLLAHGADPNARDVGDNALALHFAAGGAPLESVRALLDGGSDVHGFGDLHHMDVIGWATIFAMVRGDVVDLLIDRGARHNVFSAIAMGDPDLVERVVAADPQAIRRRLSKHEQDQGALHYVIAPADGLVGGMFRTGEHYRLLERLIALGADLEAKDAKGRTPLAIAMLRGDVEAMRILHTAGAREVEAEPNPEEPPIGTLRSSIKRLSPMLAVPDVNATVNWYRAIGFELAGSHGEGGRLDWASVTLGPCEVMFVSSGDPWRGSTAGLSLWFQTDRIDDLYASMKRRQLERSRAILAGVKTDAPELSFKLDLHTAFYGQREFGIRDPNGLELMFFEPIE